MAIHLLEVRSRRNLPSVKQIELKFELLVVGMVFRPPGQQHRRITNPTYSWIMVSRRSEDEACLVGVPLTSSPILLSFKERGDMAIHLPGVRSRRSMPSVKQIELKFELLLVGMVFRPWLFLCNSELKDVYFW